MPFLRNDSPTMDMDVAAATADIGGISTNAPAPSTGSGSSLVVRGHESAVSQEAIAAIVDLTAGVSNDVANRNLEFPGPKTIINERNQPFLLSLLRIVVSIGCHKLVSGSKEYTAGWIEVYRRAFDRITGTARNYREWADRGHTKLKVTLIEGAKHHAKLHNHKKMTGQETSTLENLSHQIISEMAEAKAGHDREIKAKRQKKAARNAENERAERELSLLPLGGAPNAPGGLSFEFEDHHREGLSYLNRNPRSRDHERDRAIITPTAGWRLPTTLPTMMKLKYFLPEEILMV